MIFLLFSGKSQKICSRLILMFRGLTFDFYKFHLLKVNFIYFIKGKVNSTIEQQK